MSAPTSAHLDAVFAALADPTRRAIVARLAEGEAGVVELAEPFQVSLPAISRHLKVLEKAGVIERGRDAQRRPCRLRPECLEVVETWVEHTRRAWEARFDRLDGYLRQLKAQQAQQAQQLPPPIDPPPSPPPSQKERKHGRRKS